MASVLLFVLLNELRKAYRSTCMPSTTKISRGHGGRCFRLRLWQEQDVGGTLLITSLFTKDQFPSLCSPNIDLIVVPGNEYVLSTGLHMTLRQAGHHCRGFSVSFLFKRLTTRNIVTICVLLHAYFFLLREGTECSVLSSFLPLSCFVFLFVVFLCLCSPP